MDCLNRPQSLEGLSGSGPCCQVESWTVYHGSHPVSGHGNIEPQACAVSQPLCFCVFHYCNTKTRLLGPGETTGKGKAAVGRGTAIPSQPAATASCECKMRLQHGRGLVIRFDPTLNLRPFQSPLTSGLAGWLDCNTDEARGQSGTASLRTCLKQPKWLFPERLPRH